MFEMLEICRDDVNSLLSLDRRIVSIISKNDMPVNFKRLLIAGDSRQHFLLELEEADIDLRLFYKQHYRGVHFSICNSCPFYKYSGCEGVERFLSGKCIHSSKRNLCIYEETEGNEDEVLSVHIPQHVFSLFILKDQARCFIRDEDSLIPAGIGNVDADNGSVCYGYAFTHFRGNIFRAYHTFLALERNGDHIHSRNSLKTISQNIKEWSIERFQETYGYTFTLNNQYPKRQEISLDSDMVIIDDDKLIDSLKFSSRTKREEETSLKIANLIQTIPRDSKLCGDIFSLLKIVD